MLFDWRYLSKEGNAARFLIAPIFFAFLCFFDRSIVRRNAIFPAFGNLLSTISFSCFFYFSSKFTFKMSYCAHISVNCSFFRPLCILIGSEYVILCKIDSYITFLLPNRPIKAPETKNQQSPLPTIRMARLLIRATSPHYDVRF
jgi:hypothetical protein